MFRTVAVVLVLDSWLSSPVAASNCDHGGAEEDLQPRPPGASDWWRAVLRQPDCTDYKAVGCELGDNDPDSDLHLLQAEARAKLTEQSGRAVKDADPPVVTADHPKRPAQKAIFPATDKEGQQFWQWLGHRVREAHIAIAEQTVLLGIGAYASSESGSAASALGIVVLAVAVLLLLGMGLFSLSFAVRTRSEVEAPLGEPGRSTPRASMSQQFPPRSFSKEWLKQFGDRPTPSSRPLSRENTSTSSHSVGVAAGSALASLGRPPSLSGLGGDPNQVPLPTLYPKLVMPHAHTRLALPLEPLMDTHWDVDVLGLSGVPLLCASMEDERIITISLHNMHTVLATMVPNGGDAVELRGSTGQLVGTISKMDGRYYLKDGMDRPVLAITDSSSDLSDLQMTSVNFKNPEVYATVKKRPVDYNNLPAEHYEVVAKPGVDSILAIAITLCVVVFIR